MPEARLIRTHRGVFRLFEHGAIASEPDRTCVFDVHRGQRYDFASQADAMAWIRGDAGAPQPLPMSEPTAEELSQWEALEADLDEEYGPDGDPLADL